MNNSKCVQSLSLLPIGFALMMDDIYQLWMIVDYRNSCSAGIFLLIFLCRKGHFRPVRLPHSLYFASLNWEVKGKKKKKKRSVLNMHIPRIISHCSFNFISILVNCITAGLLVTSYSYPAYNNNNSNLRFKWSCEHIFKKSCWVNCKDRLLRYFVLCSVK